MVYGYFHSLAGCVTSPAVAPPVAAASALRSDRRRKRVFGCQTKRRKRAVQITENTPDTTSVIWWNACVWEAKNCMMAKDAPETRVAGHTSHASLNLPPQRLALGPQEKTRLRMPDEAQEKGGADHGKYARHHVGHQVESLCLGGEELHDGEGRSRDQSRRPHFPGVLEFASLHEHEGRHQPEGNENGDEGELPSGHSGKSE